MKDLTWFIDRIGKKIYRDNNKCNCNTCLAVFAQGLYINDKLHAQYLFDVQNEIGLIYRDTYEQSKCVI